MTKNTAKGAKQERKIIFKNKEHEKFYNTYLSKCRYQDTYHKTLVYCLGLSEDTRQNVNRIYKAGVSAGRLADQRKREDCPFGI